MSDLAEKTFAAAQARAEQADEIHLISCNFVLGNISGNLNDACDCGEPDRIRALCAADLELLDVIFAYEATIDGEWGCCHSAEQIRAGECWETNAGAIPAVRALARGYGLEADS